MSDAGEIRRILDVINGAWTTARTDALAALFHADMVIAGPGYQTYAAGRDACVESYREFSTNAKVLAYSAAEPAIGVWDDTAVASYAWTMTWQRDNDPVSDAGTDQFVFTRSGGRWLAVYRLVLFRQPAA